MAGYISSTLPGGHSVTGLKYPFPQTYIGVNSEQ